MAGRLGLVIRAILQSSVLLGVLTGLASAQTGMCGSGTGVCALTWQQDTNLPSGSACSGCSYRTGENLSESTLTYSNLSTQTFGQLCSAVLDGQVYAQPLVVTHVQFQNNQQIYSNVAYVVTENDTLYAVNAMPSPGNNQCAVLGSLSLIPSSPAGQYAVDCTTTIDHCNTIGPTIGILGTPVVNIEDAR